MPLSVEQIENRIKEIEYLSEPSSKRYGYLLNWQNPSDPFWHYGIGLSDTYIFDTGHRLCPFKKENAKFIFGIEDIAFEPKQTIERLKHALRVFAHWEYTIPGWNCEHLGRLIATDQAKCYQSQPIWWLCNLTPNGEHKTACQVLRSYLAKNDPSLNR